MNVNYMHITIIIDVNPCIKTLNDVASATTYSNFDNMINKYVYSVSRLDCTT